MDLPTTIVILLVGAAVVGWLTGARDGRALEAFGSGFIGYRAYGWPRGVQEEDSVRFAFTDRRDHIDDGSGAPESSPDVEMIDLDRPPDGVTVRRLR